jgi:glutamate synthase domain-containing protein 1
MFLAPQLFAYYPDLADPRMVSALAIVHQRYSTNTFPSWRLAQPFRMVAHNGEINTLSGNRNRMRAREQDMACPALGDDLSDLVPTLTPGGSDSACFDNVLELLVRAGRSLPHSMMMLIPEAFGPSYYISTDKRAFYEYHASIMEPWPRSPWPYAGSIARSVWMRTCCDRAGNGSATSIGSLLTFVSTTYGQGAHPGWAMTSDPPTVTSLRVPTTWRCCGRSTGG